MSFMRIRLITSFMVRLTGYDGNVVLGACPGPANYIVSLRISWIDNVVEYTIFGFTVLLAWLNVESILVPMPHSSCDEHTIFHMCCQSHVKLSFRILDLDDDNSALNEQMISKWVFIK
jgi:hypothetical protein